MIASHYYSLFIYVCSGISATHSLINKFIWPLYRNSGPPHFRLLLSFTYHAYLNAPGLKISTFFATIADRAVGTPQPDRKFGLIDTDLPY